MTTKPTLTEHKIMSRTADGVRVWEGESVHFWRINASREVVHCHGVIYGAGVYNRTTLITVSIAACYSTRKAALVAALAQER